ncbi:MAG: SDR family oxidoreductase [Leeuwenhoekiella sp.]
MKEFNTENNKEWACILGGSSGLGLASAKKLASHGLNICIVHRTRRSKLDDFVKQCDLMRQDDVEVVTFNSDALKEETQANICTFFTEKQAKIRVFLHSIARGNLKPVYTQSSEGTLTNEDFSLTVNSMALSLYDWTSAFAKAKLFSPQSRIIAFTSEGSYKVLPNYAAVSAAKAALEAIIRNLAYEFAPLGITANCIQAGVTDTESLNLIPESMQIKAEALQRNPHHRLTAPEDVANVVYLLSKDEAQWITGTIIKADGGEHLR